MLNLLTLIIAAAQCVLSLFGLSMIIFSQRSAVPPAVSVILGILALGGVFLLTMLDSKIRCFNTLTFFAAFLFSPVRVAFQALTVIAVIVTLFTRHKRFADMQYPDRYPVTCIVYALTSICYLTPAARARKAADDKAEKEKFRADCPACGGGAAYHIVQFRCRLCGGDQLCSPAGNTPCTSCAERNRRHGEW